LATTLGVLGPHCQLLVLAEVVSFEAMEFGTEASLEAARTRLAMAAERASEAGVVVMYEVLAGPVGETLRQFAEEQDMDLLVVGRRGRGLSPRPMGSVSTDLVHHSTLPVLVVEP
jgi:nucleotide-binding universal stress UspA family protein